MIALRTSWTFRSALLVGGIVVASACSKDETIVQVTPAPTPTGHPQVTLRDVDGEAMPVDSRAPYSPRMTCGRCHDVDTIANAYHFQHGRTDESGRIDERLTRPWNAQVAVLSPGMFGKW